MSKREWYFLNDVIGVCRYTSLPEFEWIWWAPGTRTVEGSDPLPEGIDLEANWENQVIWLQEHWLPGFMERAKRKDWGNPHLSAAKPKSAADKAVEFLKNRGINGISPSSAQNIYTLYLRRHNSTLFNRGAAYATEEEVRIAKSL